MWDTADRSAFIDPDMPGYALGTKADASTVGGLFRNPSGTAFGHVGGTQPTFKCDEDLAPSRGETLTIEGSAFTVTDRMRDGNGFVTLDLESV